MSSHIDFYFDIISPYSYIAHKKIQKIKKHQKVIFNYKPILLFIKTHSFGIENSYDPIKE